MTNIFFFTTIFFLFIKVCVEWERRGKFVFRPHQIDVGCFLTFVHNHEQSGGLRGWTPRLGGELILENTGADLTHHSIKHTGRRSFIMGPKHELAVNCLTGGMKYSFEAKIKLIDSETGEGFECDKTKRWIDDLSCPLLSLQLNMKDGTKTWFYMSDETKGFWKKDSFNFFQASVVIDERIADADSGFFYVERVRAGVDILIDEVVLSRDCSVLISNWNAEVSKNVINIRNKTMNTNTFFQLMRY